MNVINVEHLARGRGIELVTIHEPATAGGIGRRYRRRARRWAERREPSHAGNGLRRRFAARAARRRFRDGHDPRGADGVDREQDQPGVIGTVGTSFGDAQVNIADMVISRENDPDGNGDGADGHQNRQRASGGAAEPVVREAEHREGRVGGAGGEECLIPM